jgi:hypothetical protein
MFELTITMPALFLSAISLLMMAYTNRYLALASLIRNLHSQYSATQDENIFRQIQTLRKRLTMIKGMQVVGIASLLTGMLCMFLIYIDLRLFAHIAFGLSNILFIISLFLSMWEIIISSGALEIELSKMEETKQKHA